MGVTNENLFDRAPVKVLVFACRKAELKYKRFFWHRLSLSSNGLLMFGGDGVKSVCSKPYGY